jgi:hypothetical protein
MKRIYNLLAIAAVLSILFSGCRKDDIILPPEEEQLPPQEEVLPPEEEVLPPEEETSLDTITSIVGFYLLNEGNMAMNKASLDYYDYGTSIYKRNVYGQANPDATLGLGDVGNDIGIYGSKLYTVINASNKLEIMDVATTKRLGVIDIKNGRYITFANGKAYVSAYDGEIALGQNSPNGFVAEIDTTDLTITRKVEVGRQPEELAVVENKLYVANSGGYSPPNYESTISVVDINSFTVVNKIEVAPNLHRLRATESGDLYVSSRGDYFKIPSQLFVIDTKKGEVKKTYDIPTSNLTIVGDIAYIIGSAFSYETFDWEIGYRMVDIKKEELLEDSFLPESVSNEIEMPYGVAVDPFSKNIYITDARDYVSPGTLYCIDKNGALKFTVKTGDIPAHFAFVYKTTIVEK